MLTVLQQNLLRVGKQRLFCSIYTRDTFVYVSTVYIGSTVITVIYSIALYI